MLTLWGKGGYGGSPSVEAGRMYQQKQLVFVRKRFHGAKIEIGTKWERKREGT
jgi:hypothetical protein